MTGVAVEVGSKEPALRLGEKINRRLRELCSARLSKWYDTMGWRTWDLASLLVKAFEDPEELERRIGEILGFLPRYVELVRRVLDIAELYGSAMSNAARVALEIFESLAPLSKGMDVETDIRIGEGRVLFGSWIWVYGRWGIGPIEKILSKPEAAAFLAAYGDRLAKYIEDDDKRRVFLRLVELARGLRLLRVRARGGDVEVTVYDESGYPSTVAGVLEAVLDATRIFWVYEVSDKSIDVGDRFLSIYVGDRLIDPLDPADLPYLVQVADRVEELLGALERELEDVVKRNEEILGRMAEEAYEYVVPRMLGKRSEQRP